MEQNIFIITDGEFEGSFEMKPIKLIQLEMLMDLIGDLDFGQDINSIGQITKFIRQKGIGPFMEIVFYPQDIKRFDWSQVEYEVIDRIIESFFVLNPALKKRLLQFLNDFLPKVVATLTTFRSVTELK